MKLAVWRAEVKNPLKDRSTGGRDILRWILRTEIKG
jgi:hypothetical protein